MKVALIQPSDLVDVYDIFKTTSDNLTDSPEEVHLGNIWGWLLRDSPALLFGAYVENTLVAFAVLDQISVRRKSAKLGMVAALPSKTGVGFALLKKIAAYAFNELKLNRLSAHTWSDNFKVSALYRRVGAQLEGVERQHTIKDGKYVDRQIWGLLREEYGTSS